MRYPSEERPWESGASGLDRVYDVHLGYRHWCTAYTNGARRETRRSVVGAEEGLEG
jgi:hypothetical protein